VKAEDYKINYIVYKQLIEYLIERIEIGGRIDYCHIFQYYEIYYRIVLQDNDIHLLKVNGKNFSIY
jgi:hypothetical protein